MVKGMGKFVSEAIKSFGDWFMLSILKPQDHAEHDKPFLLDLYRTELVG